MGEQMICPCCGQPWPDQMPIRQAIGWRIRLARKGAGLSQGDVGRLLNEPRTHAAVSDLERGKTKLDIDFLLELARVLDVKPGFFLDGVLPINDEEPQP